MIDKPVEELFSAEEDSVPENVKDSVPETKEEVKKEEVIKSTEEDILIGKLRTLSQLFENLKLELLELYDKASEYENNMKRTSYTRLGELMDAKDPETQKPKYTNQSQRDIALQKALDSDELYKDYKARHRKSKQEIKGKEALLEILKFKQRNILKEADLTISTNKLLGIVLKK